MATGPQERKEEIMKRKLMQIRKAVISKQV
jgi:hypothetical protein